MLSSTFLPPNFEKLVQFQENMECQIYGGVTIFLRKMSYPFKNLKSALDGQKHHETTMQLHAINWFDTSCTNHHTKNKFPLLSFPEINHSKTHCHS